MDPEIMALINQSAPSGGSGPSSPTGSNPFSFIGGQGNIMPFMAGVGFRQFQDTISKLQGTTGGNKTAANTAQGMTSVPSGPLSAPGAPKPPAPAAPALAPQGPMGAPGSGILDPSSLKSLGSVLGQNVPGSNAPAGSASGGYGAQMLAQLKALAPFLGSASGFLP